MLYVTAEKTNGIINFHKWLFQSITPRLMKCISPKEWCFNNTGNVCYPQNVCIMNSTRDRGRDMYVCKSS